MNYLIQFSIFGTIIMVAVKKENENFKEYCRL
jgi:hypothetical protein